MSETRDRIAEHVRAHPGVHFNDLVRSLDLATGQVQYHLDRLLSGGAIASEQLYGRTHYYPPTYDARERRALALLRRETAGDVVAVLLADGPAGPAAVADEVDVARSTLEWHLDRLVDAGLVAKRRDSDGRVTIEAERPEETLALLRETDATFPARLVDRFERLVDRLLEEH